MLKKRVNGQWNHMTIAVFGATGQTGKELVDQALNGGYAVRVLVSDSGKFRKHDSKMTFVYGDVFNDNAVNLTVKGCDAVIVALGLRADKGMTILADETNRIINAMKKYSVKRLIVQSSYPMCGTPEGSEYLLSAGVQEDELVYLQPLMDDKARQEFETVGSGLIYTIVRPLMLTDGRKTGNYRVGEKLEIRKTDNISRADVADYMLKSVKDMHWYNKIVSLAY
jgi:putative NADH-flavin reductase